MNKIFVEENGIYQIDLSAAVNAVGDLKEKYQSIGNFLSDVDFIAETNDAVFLIEYKNTELENAKDSHVFKEKISNGKLYDNILKKYYGSAFYILACQNEKPVNYIFIIESKLIDSVWRKRACASIKKRLPYRLQCMSEISVNLINDLKLCLFRNGTSNIQYFR